MVAEDLGAQGHRIAGSDGSVGPDLQRQLIVVAGSAHTGALHSVVDLVHGGIDTVDGDHADDAGSRRLVLVGGDIAAAVAQGDLHAQSGAHIQRCNVQLGIQDLHLAVSLDIASRDLAGSGRLDKHGLDGVAVQLRQQIFHVQNDLRHVLLHTGDGGELMLHTGNFDAGGCSSGEAGEQDAPQRIAQGRSVSALQGFDHIFSIGSVAGCFDTLDLGLLNFDHAVPSFILLAARCLPRQFHSSAS